MVLMYISVHFSLSWQETGCVPGLTGFLFLQAWMSMVFLRLRNPLYDLGITSSWLLGTWKAINCVNFCLLLYYLFHYRKGCLTGHDFVFLDLWLYYHHFKILCCIFFLRDQSWYLVISLMTKPKEYSVEKWGWDINSNWKHLLGDSFIHVRLVYALSMKKSLLFAVTPMWYDG